MHLYTTFTWAYASNISMHRCMSLNDCITNLRDNTIQDIIAIATCIAECESLVVSVGVNGYVAPPVEVMTHISMTHSESDTT